MSPGRLLALIPARGGSKGLPGKNIRPLAGVPLIGHSVLFGRSCPEVERLVVSTDSPAIAEVARQFGADVPFIRPAALAQDDTPMWEVVHHALATVEGQEGSPYEFVLLLDPTSPGRLPEDVSGALTKLKAAPDADGILAVSKPDFNPIWVCVVERKGRLANLFGDAARYTRRQDVPPVYRINGSLYLWRAGFVRRQTDSWRSSRNTLLYETPEQRAMSIDSLPEFERAEALVKGGLISFPWMRRVPRATLRVPGRVDAADPTKEVAIR
ncbi:MAG: acylneuraminate cytidylyltransferase family protein [Nitrospirae bacterium]|nr:acylneuraminate cytidylyltransferase family protein [Nitrospirota bacterium]